MQGKHALRRTIRTWANHESCSLFVVGCFHHSCNAFEVFTAAHVYCDSIWNASSFCIASTAIISVLADSKGRFLDSTYVNVHHFVITNCHRDQSLNYVLNFGNSNLVFLGKSEVFILLRSAMHRGGADFNAGCCKNVSKKVSKIRVTKTSMRVSEELNSSQRRSRLLHRLANKF